MEWGGTRAPRNDFIPPHGGAVPTGWCVEPRAAPLPEVLRPGPQEERPPSARAGAGRVPASAPQGACGGHAPAGTHLRGTPAPPACCTPPTCADPALSAACTPPDLGPEPAPAAAAPGTGGAPDTARPVGINPQPVGPRGTAQPAVPAVTTLNLTGNDLFTFSQPAPASGRISGSRENFCPAPSRGRMRPSRKPRECPSWDPPGEQRNAGGCRREGVELGRGGARERARRPRPPRRAPDGVIGCIRARAQKRAAFPVRAASRVGRSARSC